MGIAMDAAGGVALVVPLEGRGWRMHMQHPLAHSIGQADTGSMLLRRLTLAPGASALVSVTVGTLAGLAGASGAADGLGSAARLEQAPGRGHGHRVLTSRGALHGVARRVTVPGLQSEEIRQTAVHPSPPPHPPCAAVRHGQPHAAAGAPALGSSQHAGGSCGGPGSSTGAPRPLISPGVWLWMQRGPSLLWCVGRGGGGPCVCL